MLRCYISAAGITAASREYDGTSDVFLTTAGASLTGKLENSTNVTLVISSAEGAFVAVDANGSFIPDANSQIDKTVLVGGLGLAGSDAGNYVLAPYITTATIRPRVVKLSAKVVKEYDGFRRVNISTIDTDYNILQTDVTDFNLTDVTAKFSDANAGVNKEVTIENLKLRDNAAGNYDLQFTSLKFPGNITKRPLFIGGLTADKDFDNTATAKIDFAQAVYANIVQLNERGVADDVSINTATTVFPSSTIGNYTLAVTVTLKGTDAANYEVVPFNITASIIKCDNLPNCVDGKTTCVGGNQTQRCLNCQFGYFPNTNAQCTPWTTCAVGTEYEFRAGTSTTNRECRSVRSCIANQQFELVAPSNTTNRICRFYTKCTTLQYEVSAPNATSDRVCRDISPPCDERFFQESAPNATADRICQLCNSTAVETTCQEGVCAPYSFWDSINSVCIDRPTCTANEFFNKSALACATCSVLNCTEGVTQPCTADADAKCVFDCTLGYWKDEVASVCRKCTSITGCKSGKVSCSTADNSECSECEVSYTKETNGSCTVKTCSTFQTNLLGSCDNCPIGQVSSGGLATISPAFGCSCTRACTGDPNTLRRDPSTCACICNQGYFGPLCQFSSAAITCDPSCNSDKVCVPRSSDGGATVTYSCVCKYGTDPAAVAGTCLSAPLTTTAANKKITVDFEMQFLLDDQYTDNNMETIAEDIKTAICTSAKEDDSTIDVAKCKLSIQVKRGNKVYALPAGSWAALSRGGHRWRSQTTSAVNVPVSVDNTQTSTLPSTAQSTVSNAYQSAAQGDSPTLFSSGAMTQANTAASPSFTYSASTLSTPTSSGSSGLSGGAIAGIVIGSVAGAAILLGGTLYVLKKRKNGVSTGNTQGVEMK